MCDDQQIIFDKEEKRLAPLKKKWGKLTSEIEPEKQKFAGMDIGEILSSPRLEADSNEEQVKERPRIGK